MTVCLLLLAQDLRQPRDGLLRIDRTARVIGRIHNDRLRIRREQSLERGKVDLKILRAGWHDNESAADGLHEAAILRKKRSEGDELIPLFAKRLKADGDRSGSACRHEDIFPLIVHVKPAVQALRHCRTHLGMTGRHRIAVDLIRSLRLQDIHRCLADEIRRRYIRIAQTEVKHLILTDLGRAFPAKFKDRANCRFFRTQFIHLLRNHICHPSSSLKKYSRAASHIKRHSREYFNIITHKNRVAAIHVRWPI